MCDWTHCNLVEAREDSPSGLSARAVHFVWRQTCERRLLSLQDCGLIERFPEWRLAKTAPTLSTGCRIWELMGTRNNSMVSKLVPTGLWRGPGKKSGGKASGHGLRLPSSACGSSPGLPMVPGPRRSNLYLWDFSLFQVGMQWS